MSERDDLKVEVTTGDDADQKETEPKQSEVTDSQEAEAEAEKTEAGEDGIEDVQEGIEGEDSEAVQQAQVEREKAIQAYQQALIERNGLLLSLALFYY